MNTEAQQLLNSILQKQLQDLTDDDKRFLRARQSYLNPIQLQTYKDFLVVSKDYSEIRLQVSYSDLLKQAKEMGYKGPKMKFGELSAWIDQHK